MYNVQCGKILKQILNFKFHILHSKSGFTLIELMVTIAIIAVLAAVGLVVYSTAQKSGRISKRVQDLNAIRTALELFKATNGSYPSVTTAGTPLCLDSLSVNNSLSPNYMPVVPKDPIQSGATYCYMYMADTGGASPTATVYKVRTSVAATEMSSADFLQQPALIDPNRDAVAANGCTIDPASATAWAVYSSTTVACNY